MPFVAQAIPKASQANTEVTFNEQCLAGKISDNTNSLIETGLRVRVIVTNNHSADCNAFSTLKNIQFRVTLLYKAPAKQKQNILILWDCSSYEKQKYVTCCSPGHIRWVDL